MACSSATLSGILKECGTNLGGVSVAYIAERNLVTGVTVTDGVITAITMGTSGKFKTYEFNPNTSSLNSETTIEDSGVKYVTNTVQLVFAKQDSAKRAEMMALLEDECVVIVKDRNGKYWWIGGTADTEESANVSALTATTGTALGDSNNYTIDLQSISVDGLPYEVSASAVEAVI